MSAPEQKYTGPPLSQIYFYLTEGCNLRCRHCWIMAEQDPAEASKSKAVLDFALFQRILEQARPLGLKTVKLTGGEPFLHPQIAQILEMVRDSQTQAGAGDQRRPVDAGNGRAGGFLPPALCVGQPGRHRPRDPRVGAAGAGVSPGGPPGHRLPGRGGGPAPDYFQHHAEKPRSGGPHRQAGPKAEGSVSEIQYCPAFAPGRSVWARPGRP